MLEASIKLKFVLSHSGANTTECIFTSSFFEEICLALQRDHFHPFKRVCDIEQSRLMQAQKEVLSYKLNVLGHLVGIHADQ